MKKFLERLVYWLFKSKVQNKQCGSCCLTCKYYDFCKNDN